MVCYLCVDYTREPLFNCSNKLCKNYFHKSCWLKYLEINNIKKSKCKVCYTGNIDIENTKVITNEVQSCGCYINECNFIVWVKELIKTF